MRRWNIHILRVVAFNGCCAGMAIGGWLAHAWWSPPPSAAALKMIGATGTLIDIALLKCASAIIVVGPRHPGPDAGRPWDEALSRIAANALAVELRERGFQTALSSYNVICKPVPQVRVVAPDARGGLDAEISSSTATVVLYVALDSVESTENTPTTLAFSHRGGGDIQLPESPDIEYHWDTNGSSRTTGTDNELAEASDLPAALAAYWARNFYMGMEFSMGKAFLGALSE